MKKREINIAGKNKVKEPKKRFVVVRSKKEVKAVKKREY